MRPGALFVSTARGGWSTTRRCWPPSNPAGSAAPDSSTTPEPLPPDHPLLGRDDVVVTPHVASATADG